MERTEKFVLIFSIIIMLVFISGILIASKGLGIEVPECQPVEKTFTEGRLGQLDEHTYQAYYVAKMWTFEPREIEIPLESDLDIFLTSTDVVHGFHINHKGINLMAVPGTINKQRVHFNKRGEYEIVCHEFCGTGHQNMAAKIIVK
jgi:cytochrome c oxidase subunit 2